MDGQRAKPEAFLTMAFGDPNEYSGADLRVAHEKLVADGLNDIPFSCRNGICLTCMMRVREGARPRPAKRTCGRGGGSKAISCPVSAIPMGIWISNRSAMRRFTAAAW